jgi:hypothetical protein
VSNVTGDTHSVDKDELEKKVNSYAGMDVQYATTLASESAVGA